MASFATQVVKLNRFSVYMPCSFRKNDQYAFSLHYTHHSFDGNSIDNELFLRNRAAELEQISPAARTENKFTGDKIRGSCLCKSVYDHRVEIRLMVGQNDYRTFVLHELLIGPDSDMSKRTDDRNEEVEPKNPNQNFLGTQPISGSREFFFTLTAAVLLSVIYVLRLFSFESMPSIIQQKRE